MKVGVLALQGGVAEHVYMLRKAFQEERVSGEVIPVKRRSELGDLDGIVLPGGESTTIGALAKRTGLLNELRDAIRSGLPVMGVCAGAVMLAKVAIDRVVGRTNQPLLALMNIKVVRNYYGRQRESFEVDLRIPALGAKPFRGVFVRAPAISEVWEPARSVAELEGVTVMAHQDHMLALTFHPELTEDARVHRAFIRLIRGGEVWP